MLRACACVFVRSRALIDGSAMKSRGAHDASNDRTMLVCCVASGGLLAEWAEIGFNLFSFEEAIKWEKYI